MEIEEVIGMAKKVVEQQKGEHDPTFFVEDGDGNYSIVVMPFPNNEPETKEMAREALSQLVEQQKSTKYFSVFVGWSVNQHEVKEKFNKEFKKLVKESKNIKTEKDKEAFSKKFYDFIGNTKSLMNSPSEHPDAREVLIITECVKGKGSRSVVVPMIRKDGKLEFGHQESMTAGRYDRFNVWAQYQIDLTEDEEKGGKNGI